ncbi:carbohydrate esterase family 5 protein [Ramaria rubella]|nr:carbohydrate esterase family 5 protein [Ramaria rubella]
MFNSLALQVVFLLFLGACAVPSSRAACTDVTVIFARGTFEAEPIGTIVGPPFQGNLTIRPPPLEARHSFTGVNYPADVEGFLEGGDPQGAATMAADLTQVANDCPDTAIVSSGYSQGAQLVHLSAEQLSASVASRIVAVVMFGDPDNGTALTNGLQGKDLTFCAAGDNICMGGDLILPAHLSYGADAPAAAQFVVGKV